MKPALTAEEHVYGTLGILENGRTEIELDGVMPTDQHPFVENLSHIEPRSDISGLNIRSNEYFCLVSPRVIARSSSSSGFSHQKWSSFLCLVRAGSPFKSQMPKYSSLRISLCGFEEWLGVQGSMPKFKRGPRVQLKHTGQKDVVYKLDDGSITIEFNLNVSISNPSGTKTTLTEEACLIYRFKIQRDVNSIFQVHRDLNDILLLVTDRERGLAWPAIKHRREKLWTSVYFEISNRGQDMVTRADCWTYFPQIKQDFGRILNTWRVRFSESRPAFYLYGGTRRQESIYTEHKFINLVWGLEALSNPTYQITSNKKLLAKVDRIRSLIEKSQLKSSDKSMAIRNINYALLPTLADRLIEIIGSLDVNINSVKIKTFAEKCAEIRNSLSHEGGARPGESYSDFIQNVVNMSIALDVIYHLKLLQELGLSAIYIDAILNKIFLFNQVRARLRLGDLEPESSSS